MKILLLAHKPETEQRRAAGYKDLLQESIILELKRDYDVRPDVNIDAIKEILRQVFLKCIDTTSTFRD